MKANSYLTFNGNCREAITFYQSCLGGELTFLTIGESPFSNQMPAHMKDCIMHATLINGNTVLMASDMVGERGLIRGNAHATMLNFSSETAIRTCYEKLSQGGKQEHPLELTFWGALFGDLMDKFGNHWLLHFELTETAISILEEPKMEIG